MQNNVSIEWCLEKLEALQKCNLNPQTCTHDHDETGNARPFDYASIDMTLDAVISELKRMKERNSEDENEIKIVWSVEDVFSLMFPDEDGTRGHTDEELDIARKVLDLAKDNHDATVGINWDVLQMWLDEVQAERSAQSANI